MNNMAKVKLQYICTQCSAIHNKWAGQCGDCGQWNCLEESVVQAVVSQKSSRFSTYAGDTGGQKIQKLGAVKFSRKHQNFDKNS